MLNETFSVIFKHLVEDEILDLFAEMKDFYADLHAYVRRKLFEIYGEDVIDLKGPLPASVLSDMWGRFWNNLFKDMVPYPEKPDLDPSQAMKEQVSILARKLLLLGMVGGLCATANPTLPSFPFQTCSRYIRKVSKYRYF